MIEQLRQWNTLKERLNEKNPDSPFVSEGDIWWVSLDEALALIKGKRPTIHLFDVQKEALKRFSN